MKKIVDPNLLAKLEGKQPAPTPTPKIKTQPKEVTDSELLQKLEADNKRLTTVNELLNNAIDVKVIEVPKRVEVPKIVEKEVIKEVPVEKIVTVEKIVEKIVEKEVEVKPKKQYNKKSLFTPAQEPVQAGGVTDDGEIDKDS